MVKQAALAAVLGMVSLETRAVVSSSVLYLIHYIFGTSFLIRSKQLFCLHSFRSSSCNIESDGIINALNKQQKEI